MGDIDVLQAASLMGDIDLTTDLQMRSQAARSIVSLNAGLRL
jgi:hypothetical protein